MPGLRVHTYVDRLFLGRSYYKIHREMDKPFKFLRRAHRVMFHDPVSAVAIARRLHPGDPKAVRAAFLHIYVDNLCSKNPRVREILEIAARLDSRRRRRKKRKRR